MSLQVFVKDRTNAPASNVRVFVKWKGGGTSSGRTSHTGYFDTRVNSRQTVEYIQVDDNNQKWFTDVYPPDSNYVFQISINRKAS